MKKTKLSLSELRQKANEINNVQSLNSIKGGEGNIPISHGDEAGTGRDPRPSPSPFPVPKPTLP